MTGTLFEYEVTPTVSVVVDESHCIVLRTRKGNNHTISNVDALTDALAQARAFVATREAVIAAGRSSAEAVARGIDAASTQAATTVDWRGRTFGQLTPEEKRQVTGEAAAKLKTELEGLDLS